MLPCPGYYKQCCDEHRGTRVSLDSGFLSVYVQQWDCWVIWQFMASGPITSWEIDGETVETVSDFIFGAPKSLHMVTAAMKLKDAYSLEGKL